MDDIVSMLESSAAHQQAVIADPDITEAEREKAMALKLAIIRRAWRIAQQRKVAE